MSLAGSLREEAALLADHRPFEILQRAREAVRRSRFARIRKHKAPAETEQEKAYLNALGMYVHLKILLKREQKRDWSHRCFVYSHTLEADMRRWRDEMNRIEFCWGAAS